MTDASTILQRLREEPESIATLVTLGLDHLLDRPMAELVDASVVARAISEGVRSSARSDAFEGWVAARVEQALARADKLHGPLAERVPVTLLGPLENALRRPYQPDPELVRALLDHPSTRAILRELLQANILEFGKRMREMMPTTGKLPGGAGGFASRLAGVAKGVASAVGNELEKQLEPRVERFVEEALGVAVDMMIAQVASEAFAPDLAAWRIDVLHSLLGQPIDRLIAERHKYPAADFAADVAAILRALSAWRGLTDALERGLGELIREHGSQTTRDFLDGSGLEDAWRPALQRVLVEQVREVVAGEEFASWLVGLVDR
ncbi:hypothetical protein G6O69_26410 [Pseudenhygromyxa sp. WMMC2535]|uniref:hypothetical protein n=1 Tax=Pseudenhygromyxa sp. WMMC2535 TaxID=2712867 RepID=UPI001554DB8D|nr:hypothetical protein [Pseudenhygromyxa sp. WMMC2535]NVB41399.1 hypothetical protein [Pseudenhygromyxa sp. WMMC2535]